MKRIVVFLAMLAAAAAWTHDAPATATTTPSGCNAPSMGDLEFALDTATHTLEAATQGWGRQHKQRLDLRFALPKWVSHWDCYEWEVEAVLPSCVYRFAPVMRNDFPAVGGALLTTGLGLTDNAAHWTVEVDHAQSHHGEIVDYRGECFSYANSGRTFTDLQRGWFVVRVRERRNPSVFITLPGGNSSRRLYPFSVGVRL